MHPALSDDLARFPELLQVARDFAAREVAGLAARPVACLGPPPVAEPLPSAGAGTQGALARFAERWAPGFSASAGPRYLGFVVRGATPAAVSGDWLASAYDQNVSGAGDSSAIDLERETLGWLRELLGLSQATAVPS